MKSALFFTLSMLTTSSAQILPGVHRPHQSMEGMESCTHESNKLLTMAEIHEQISHISNQAASVILENFCKSQGNLYTCAMDYSSFGHKLETVCEVHQGKYMESHHKVVCVPAADGAENAQTYAIQLLHFPDCFGKDCAPADIQRLVSRSVREYAKALESQMPGHFVCHADYEMNDGHMQEIMHAEAENLHGHLGGYGTMEGLENHLGDEVIAPPGPTTSSEDETSGDEYSGVIDTPTTRNVSTILLLLLPAIMM